MYLITTADSVSILYSNPRSSIVNLPHFGDVSLKCYLSHYLVVTWITFEIPNFSSLEDGFSFQFQIRCVFIAVIPIFKKLLPGILSHTLLKEKASDFFYNYYLFLFSEKYT